MNLTHQEIADLGIFERDHQVNRSFRILSFVAILFLVSIAIFFIVIAILFRKENNREPFAFSTGLAILILGIASIVLLGYMKRRSTSIQIFSNAIRYIRGNKTQTIFWKDIQNIYIINTTNYVQGMVQL